MFCRSCRHVWRPAGPGDDGECPECGSTEVVESFPDIPDLSDDPGVGLILAVESQIARAENGAILHLNMVAWLNHHGVTARGEILQWEEWFRAIAGMRGRVMEELMDVSTRKKSDDEDEER